MTQIDNGWGADQARAMTNWHRGSARYFQRIRAGAVERELARRLPLEEIKQTETERLGALRVPAADGGAGASLRNCSNLLIELSEADSNLTQGLRGHFGFAEDVVNSTDQARRIFGSRASWRGDIVGNAWSEVGEAKSTAFSTRVTPHGETLRLNGEKYYTTGSFYADWIDVGSTDEDGESVGATVARDAPGVLVRGRLGFSPRLVGIGRAASTDVARLVRSGDAPTPTPTVRDLLRTRRSADCRPGARAVYGAGAIVLRAADAVQRAFDTTEPVTLMQKTTLSRSPSWRCRIADRGV